MSWAAKRRLIITIIVGAMIVAFLSIVGITTLYQAPSCSDNKQNQGESGIDCGGPCAYLCSAEMRAPTVLFTKLIQNSGRVDVIASVENKNPNAAARGIPFVLTLYGPDRLPVGEVKGSVDLPPGASVPVYIAGVPFGKQKPASAFLLIDPSVPKWYSQMTDPRTLPSISNTVQGGTVNAPRIETVLINQTVTTLMNVKVIVLVRDVNKEVIAASQTIVPVIPAQGQASAIFTWNQAFPGVPASIEILPAIPLPAK